MPTQDQTSLGSLYAELSALLARPVTVAETDALIAKYGADDVRWIMGVLADDLAEA